MVQSAKTKRIFDGRFEIVGIVGRGSQSVVYHARNATSPDTQVALKVLVNQNSKTQSGPSLSEKLRKEALAMVAARHKYVVRIEDFHSIDSLCYLSMEYAAEGDLRKYISSHDGKLPVAQAERFFRQTVEALCAVHKSGIIHRDIKPDNILVINDREIRLADFGVAVLPGDESSIAELQKGVGTFSYMAPEVLEGIEYKEAADLYSLGVTFYELLTGIHPFDKINLIDQLKARKDENLKAITSIVPGIPDKFAKAIMLCLAYSKEDRPKSSEELLDFISGNNKVASHSPKITKSTNTPLVSKVEVITESTKTKEFIPNVSPTITKTPALEKHSALGESSAMAAISRTLSNTPAPIELNPVIKKEELIDSTEDYSRSFATPSINNQSDEQKNQGSIVSNLLDVPNIPTYLPKSDTQAPLITKDILNLRSVEPADPELKVKNDIRDIISGKIPINKFDVSAKKRIPVVGIIFALLLLAIYYRFSGESQVIERELTPKAKFQNENSLPSESSEVEKEPSSDEPLIPKSGISRSAFPLLSSGIYHGEIHGLYPETKLALTLISFAEKERIAVIVGIEGWQPILVSTLGLKEGDPLKLSANGFVLQITGKQLEDGEFVGYFKNLVVGDQGEWRVKFLASTEK